jgi:hypothetical protein
MATYQTSYGINKARGLPGQVSTLEESNRITRTVETAAGIAFGQPVQRGTADRGAAILSTGDFLGLAILHVAVAPDAANPDAYPQYSELGIMTEGTMYVTAGGTVAPGDLVYWDAATGKYSNLNTDVEVPGATFEETAGDGDIVEIALMARPLTRIDAIA